MEGHISLTTILQYLHAFHKKPRDHSSPFDKLFRSSLRWWFMSDGKFKLGVKKSIKRGKAFIIIEKHISILDQRP
jgi:hypothetical protein